MSITPTNPRKAGMGRKKPLLSTLLSVHLHYHPMAEGLIDFLNTGIEERVHSDLLLAFNEKINLPSLQ
jgi:hypothetical protein